MKLRVPVSVLLIAVAAVTGATGCSKDSNPNVPDVVQTTTTIRVSAPLAIATVAPYVGQTINSVLERALAQGLTKKGAGRWTYDCPAGGNGRVDLSDSYQVQTGNVVMLTDTEFVLTDCTIETNVTTLESFLARVVNLLVRPLQAQSRARIVARGRLRTKGKWRAPIMTSRGPEYRQDEGAHVTGSIDVSQVNCGGGNCPSQIGPISLDCNLDGKVCAGSIGGVGVQQGPPDTPPPPNPTTTTSTTTTTVPSGGGGAVNVGGRWLESISGGSSSGSRTVVLSQSGSSISGSASDTPAGVSASFTGTISGGSVTLNERYTFRESSGGVSLTCVIDIRHVLTATSTRMSGNWTSTGSCSGAVNIPLGSESGSATFTR